MPPSNENERLSDLEKDASHLKEFIEKLDVSVEKLTAISADVTQLLAVHENRLTFQERMHNQLDVKVEKKFENNDERFGKLYEKIEEVKLAVEHESNLQTNEILRKLDENNKKVGSLEKWMWTCLGGGTVLLFAIDKIVPNLPL